MGPSAQARSLWSFCRIVAEWGYIEAFGHISIRVPGTDIILVTPGAISEKTTVCADQVFVYDINGKLLHHPGGESVISEPTEYFIHIRIHRGRPKLRCVAHLHSPYSTLLGICNRPIVPVYNQTFYLHAEVPTWDNPQLVAAEEQADPLSKTSGEKVACQMRGQGSVVLEEASDIGLMNVYTIEENVKYETASEPLGCPVVFPKKVIEESAKQRGSMTVEISKLLWACFERMVFMAGLPLFRHFSYFFERCHHADRDGISLFDRGKMQIVVSCVALMSVILASPCSPFV